VMDENDLIRKLSKKSKKGVRFSDDGSIRSVQYGFGMQWQDSEQIRNNPLPIALTGDLEAGEKLAEIQNKIGKRGYVGVLDIFSQHVIKVPILSENEVGLILYDYAWGELDGDGRSFGVRQ